MKYVIDIWTGELSQNWDARYIIEDFEVAAKIMKAELGVGNLVNILLRDTDGAIAFDNRRMETVQ